MPCMRSARITFALILTSVLFASNAPGQSAAPHLERRGQVTQLIVDGKPFLMLGGELLNSSSSSLDFMKPLWPKLAALPANTILTPLTWELLEPLEGHYDFALLDGLLAQARENHLHLVFLWLAAWKNGVSSYPPAWVREDTARFPRAVLHGDVSSTLSTLEVNSKALLEADKRAFVAVMQHLKAVDSRDHTVLMMQVENEVGTLSDTRDHSAAANASFAAAVPLELTAYLTAHRDTLNSELRALWLANGAKTSGTWAEVFSVSSRADEVFMAWNYAHYVQQIAAAGKAAYDLPMYVNCWLGGNDGTPGTYPSGGPQPRVLDVWKAAGPALDIIAPDLYAANFADWAGWYHRADNPLFLPETNGGANGADWVFYAVGEHAALGFSPFAIDAPYIGSIANSTDPAVLSIVKGMADLGESYAAIQAVAPILLEQQTKGRVHGFHLTRQHPAVEFTMDGLSLQVSLDEVFGNRAEAGYGLVMMTGKDAMSGHAEFLGVGKGFRVMFLSRAAGKHIGLGAVDEGVYVNGQWHPGRRLNGDETDQGGAWRFDTHALHTEKVSIFTY